jgi:alkanesulfonate monooxygenase SsuD/methylene tetrahydromethanopterin reductase-like flavin-dependent oxidoreductase (luciferase family)
MSVQSRPPVTFGLRLPNSGPLATAEAVLEAAREAERLGYDTVWVHDHISWMPENLTHFSVGSIDACKGQKPNFFESLSTLAVIAGQTCRVQLGVAGLVVTFRDPRVLARQALTIDSLSGGRLILAMGIGEIQNDFDALQVPRKQRGRIANEHLAALDAALSQNAVAEYHGERIDFSGAGFFPKPIGLKRWIVGHSDAALARVVRLASGWLTAHLSLEDFGARKLALSKALAEGGRSEASVTCVAELFVAIEDTPDEALRVASRSLEHFFGSVEKGLRRTIVGTPQQAIEQLRAYIQAGADHFELRLFAHSMEHYLSTARRIAEEVISKIR